MPAPPSPRGLEVEHRSRDHARRGPSLGTDSDKGHRALRGYDLARGVHGAKDGAASLHHGECAQVCEAEVLFLARPVLSAARVEE